MNDLDRKLAEQVMGWSDPRVRAMHNPPINSGQAGYWYWSVECDYCKEDSLVNWQPSENIEQAMMIVGALELSSREGTWHFQLRRYQPEGLPPWHCVIFWKGEKYLSYADTPAMAICLAAEKVTEAT